MDICFYQEAGGKPTQDCYKLNFHLKPFPAQMAWIWPANLYKSGSRLQILKGIFPPSSLKFLSFPLTHSGIRFSFALILRRYVAL